ncbi:hypothetical protein [Erythrobacter sp. WG]|uniref:hypothetical protein n=1 Tax=Erythrobacter sp. WG TaxID=2985510 RepID=UPI002270797C|nr:hypothetical protein [Erythrobacter sp. WG]MCX9146628.1 hypothetical protein [Erythrobacter sp. WG]
MKRIDDHPGLARSDTWHEIAYETGEPDWPLARVRITPVVSDTEDRLHQPNAPAVPARVEVRISASLIDTEGAVERIAGRLLLGPETSHAWQFHADTPFDPAAWLDACAARVISDIIRQARGISAAADAGLLLN